MRKIFFVLCGCIFLVAAGQTNHDKASANSHFRTVGYLMVGRSNVLAAAQKINFNALTHLNLAFINPDSSGNFKGNHVLQQIIQLAHTSHVKVLMSIGGGNIPAYLTKFLTDDNQQVFIKNILAEVEKYDFDGVDVDFEGDAVNSNYSKFVIGLARPITARHKLITAAVATWFAGSVTDSALAAFDFINVMSYDKTGPWQPSKPGPHAPYAMAVSDINYWHITRGVDKQKLNLGLPFYGYGFGANNTTSEMGFGKIIAAYPGAESTDSVLLHNGQTMYYNGIPTIKSKAAFALQQTGGVMIWELTQDAIGSLSLLKSITDVVEAK